jgi:hypothetical protein
MMANAREKERAAWGVAQSLLTQMDPRRAYRSCDFDIPKNKAGIREANGPLRSLKKMRFVASSITGKNNLLWVITPRGLDYANRAMGIAGPRGVWDDTRWVWV